jgi:hypothetical protein
MGDTSSVMAIGAVAFGASVGFIAYRTLIRTTEKAAITDLGAVVGVIGGAAVTGLFNPDESDLFGWYSIGLAGGIAIYFILFTAFNGVRETAKVMGSRTRDTGTTTPNGPQR